MNGDRVFAAAVVDAEKLGVSCESSARLAYRRDLAAMMEAGVKVGEARMQRRLIDMLKAAGASADILEKAILL